MPELPEVETIKRGLSPVLEGAMIYDVVIRNHQLRWPIPSNLRARIREQRIIKLSRRGKYLLMQLEKGALIIHLGMSGSLRILNSTTPPARHDHVDLVFSSDQLLRYNDPRRFGAVLWTEDDPHQHPLIKSMGVEPLDEHFTGQYLYQRSRERRVPIKSFIMNGRIVTGVGNIYAAEALFMAKIHPLIPAGQLSQQQCECLVDAIQKTLQSAIKQGGTTLKDFVNAQGKPGYFSQNLHVYGREGLPCTNCGAPLLLMQLGQRSTVFCERCQA